jgi:hypothetical protein
LLIVMLPSNRFHRFYELPNAQSDWNPMLYYFNLPELTTLVSNIRSDNIISSVYFLRECVNSVPICPQAPMINISYSYWLFWRRIKVTFSQIFFAVFFQDCKSDIKHLVLFYLWVVLAFWCYKCSVSCQLDLHIRSVIINLLCNFVLPCNHRTGVKEVWLR